MMRVLSARPPSLCCRFWRRSVLRALVVSLLSGGAWAVDEAVLWLPLSQQKLYPRLYQLALQLENTPRCEKVISGKLHEASQASGAMRFFFVCRDDEFRSYSVLADPHRDSFEYPLQIMPPERDLAAERRALLQFGRQQCESLFADKTRYMRELTRLTPALNDVEFDPVGSPADGWQFQVDFDAVDLQRRPLQYRALCQVREMPVESSEEDLPLQERTRVEMSIKPRLTAAPTTR